ncbi:MAG: acetate/propionate family kinase [Polyangiaceae bacterium]|nr:acetate/propionate family kinase [Polyangiaceae bacterium]
MRVLLLNAGSSSLKCTLMESVGASVVARATADWAGAATRYERVGPGSARRSEEVLLRGHGDAVRHMLDDLGGAVSLRPEGSDALAAVGHRIVHGGAFHSSVRITSSVRETIASLAALAPLHNPPGLETLAAAESALGEVPHVAVFDTAFHATLPPSAYTYPLPIAWSEGWGIRRYGFHGLSHSYCARRAAEMLGRDVGELRTIICHLGHGCSATAVLGGASVDTTMGFTPLDGLMMGTRSGAVDPGILMHVQQHHALTAQEVDAALNHRSGLLGVSGLSADMREVLAARDDGDARAKLAVEVYSHRVRQAIGALAVTLGGVDALVFTAGVGEHAAVVRSEVCRGLECLGIVVDDGANHTCRPDADISRRGAAVRTLVIATREDIAMLEDVVRVIAT